MIISLTTDLFLFLEKQMLNATTEVYQTTTINLTRNEFISLTEFLL